MIDDMARQFFSGNTIEQAILAAARQHGLDPIRIAYKLRDKKQGLNLRRKVVIEVDPAAPEQSTEVAPDPIAQGPIAAGPAPAAVLGVEGRSEHSGVDRETGSVDETLSVSSRDRRRDEMWHGEKSSWAGEGAADREVAAFECALEEVLKLLGLRIDASVRRAEVGYEIELSGTDSEALVMDQGKVLRGVEHLLPRMVRGLIGYGLPCRVDSEGFRAAHEQDLRRLAEEVAEEVRSSMEERRLDPMNPFDRRLVHLALADDPTVWTESTGDGFLKQVNIIPGSPEGGRTREPEAGRTRE